MILEGEAKLRISTIAERESTRCALIGYGIGLLIIAPIAVGNWNVFGSPQFIFPFILVSLALFILASVFGRIAGGIILRTNSSRFRPWLAGLANAWFTVIVSTILGCLPAVFFETGDLSQLGHNLFSYVGKPLIWVSFFGLIPSTLLGLHFTSRVRRRLPLP